MSGENEGGLKAAVAEINSLLAPEAAGKDGQESLFRLEHCGIVGQITAKDSLDAIAKWNQSRNVFPPPREIKVERIEG